VGIVAGEALPLDNGLVPVAAGVLLPVVAAEAQLLDRRLLKGLAVAVAGIAAAVIQGTVAARSQQFHEGRPVRIVAREAASLAALDGAVSLQQVPVGSIVALGAEGVALLHENEPVAFTMIEMTGRAVVFHERTVDASAAFGELEVFVTIDAVLGRRQGGEQQDGSQNGSGTDTRFHKR
jgi:hypothetical protein